MSNCSQHKKEVAGISDMNLIAEMIEGLHYEAMAELFNRLAVNYMKRYLADKADNKIKLSKCSLWMHYAINKASYGAEKAWQISKPFMENNNSAGILAGDE